MPYPAVTWLMKFTKAFSKLMDTVAIDKTHAKCNIFGVESPQIIPSLESDIDSLSGSRRRGVNWPSKLSFQQPHPKHALKCQANKQGRYSEANKVGLTYQLVAIGLEIGCSHPLNRLQDRIP